MASKVGSTAGTSSPESAPSGTKLALGARVIVRGTADVLKRFPRLAGLEGTICEVPAHPNTWYKVECKDKQIGTMRPSALEVVKSESPSRVGGGGGSVASTVARSLAEGAGKGVAKGGSRTGGRASKDVPDSGRGGRATRECRGGENYKDEAEDSEEGIPLTSVAMDTWVGRSVRITTEKHRDVTGLVVRTGNGWVNLHTSQGEVAKRAYDLVLAGERTVSDSDYTPKADKGDGKGTKPKGAKAGPAASCSSGTTSGTIEEKRPGRGRSTRNSATAASATGTDGSDKDDDEDREDGDGGEYEEEGMGLRRRRTGSVHSDGSDDPAREEGADEDLRDDDGDDKSDDEELKGPRRGVCSPPKSSRMQAKERARERWDKGRVLDTTKDAGKVPARAVAKGRDMMADRTKDKGKGKLADIDRIRDRDLVKDKVERLRGVNGREWDGAKGEVRSFNFKEFKGKERAAGPVSFKDKDLRGASAHLGGIADDMEDRGGGRDHVERPRERVVNPIPPGRKEGPTEAQKQAIQKQAQLANLRPNLEEWKVQLEDITLKDSCVDYESPHLCVALMPIRCNHCLHEQEELDGFCWNEKCWTSPVYEGFFKPETKGGNGNKGGREGEAMDMDAVPEAQANGKESGPVQPTNSFIRDTIINPTVTYRLQAPVKWIETKKRRRPGHELFSGDGPLYRWQCWQSTSTNAPEVVDHTFVKEPVHRQSGNEKRMKTATGRAPGTLKFRTSGFSSMQNPMPPNAGTGNEVGVDPQSQPGAAAIHPSLMTKRTKSEPVEESSPTANVLPQSGVPVTCSGLGMGSAILPSATPVILPPITSPVSAAAAMPSLPLPPTVVNGRDIPSLPGSQGITPLQGTAGVMAMDTSNDGVNGGAREDVVKGAHHVPGTVAPDGAGLSQQTGDLLVAPALVRGGMGKEGHAHQQQQCSSIAPENADMGMGEGVQEVREAMFSSRAGRVEDVVGTSSGGATSSDAGVCGISR